jgi:hypothetical protein
MKNLVLWNVDVLSLFFVLVNHVFLFSHVILAYKVSCTMLITYQLFFG